MIDFQNYLSLKHEQGLGWPLLSLTETEEEVNKESLLSQNIFNKLLPAFINSKESHFRIGLMYLFGGHTTPLIIDIKDLENDELSQGSQGSEFEGMTDFDIFNDTFPINEEVGSNDNYVTHNECDKESTLDENLYRYISVNIYNTDSRAFDVENGAALKETLIALVQTAFKKEINLDLFANGLIVTDENNKNTIRQHVDGYCSLFSLIDLETLLAQPDLDTFFPDTIEVSMNQSRYLGIELQIESDMFGHTNLHQIYALPTELMLYIQSVHGNDASARRGLFYFSKHRISPGIISLDCDDSKLTIDAAPLVSRFSSKTNMLTQYLISQQSKEGISSLDISSLYHFIEEYHIPQNFVLDAIRDMYEAQTLNFLSNNEYNFDISRYALDDFEHLMFMGSQTEKGSVLPDDMMLPVTPRSRASTLDSPGSPLLTFYQTSRRKSSDDEELSRDTCLSPLALRSRASSLDTSKVPSLLFFKPNLPSDKPIPSAERLIRDAEESHFKPWT